MGGAGENDAGGRAIVYCLVPRELAGKLHEPLRRHFKDEPGVEVVPEWRHADRRKAAERRTALIAGKSAPATERRRVRSGRGRRVAERRATLVEIDGPPLPRRFNRHRTCLAFVERLEPTTQQAEDADTARLVMRFQAGESDVFGALYMRYFDRVFAYLKIMLDDAHEAEDLSQQIFLKVLEGLPAYEYRGEPFRAWLFIITRNSARTLLKRRGRIEPMDAFELREHQERATPGASELPTLDWISDRDMVFLVERLPPPQRQVLVLRFMLDLSPREIAQVLGMSANHVSVLQYRALGFLADRLTALGREPRDRSRARMVRSRQQNRLIRRRRFVLVSPDARSWANRPARY